MEANKALLRLWKLGKSEHTKLKKSVLLALLGVIFGLIPYICAANIIVGLVNNERKFSFYLLWSGGALVGYVLKTLLYNLALVISHKGAFNILKNIRQMILEKLPKLPLGSIMDISSGKMKQIIIDQVESMETTLAHLIPEMTSNLIAPILVLVYLFILDWRMALLSIVSIPVGMAFMMSVMGNYEKDYAQAVKTTQDMNETIVEYIGGIEVIKAFNQGKNSYTKFSDRVKANASYYYNWMKRCQLNMALAYAIAPTTLITILPLGFIFYVKGSISLETFITIIILSMSIVAPLLEAMGFIDNLAKVGTIVGSVDEILMCEEQNHSKTPVILKNTNIDLKNVSFGYTKDKEIIHNINLFIPKGTVTGLVGPSGGGKSTIAKLIAGFWDAPSGQITIGDVDVKDVPLSQIYDQVAFVSQDNFLFDDTVLENIRMGKVTATDDEVVAVAKASGCDTFIRSLGDGYKTKVGAGGTHLSGGERQRIAIARAMLKDSPIIVLDEATAYIDPENEVIIQQALAHLIKGKTLILVAHRLSTVIDADQIVLIKEGKIEAIGTHEELQEESSLYESMWRAHIGARGEETVC